MLAFSAAQERQFWPFFAVLVLSLAAYDVAHIYNSLAAVRPLMVFVLVDGAPPPVSGICALFGR